MKKRTKFNPKLITNTFFPGVDPIEINHGRCFMWAFLTASTFKGVELWDTYIHAFVKRNGLFYDSENLTGVDDPMDLRGNTVPGFFAGDPGQRSLYRFKRNWATSAIMFQTSWKQMEEQAKLLMVK